jgi:NifU-like protein
MAEAGTPEGAFRGRVEAALEQVRPAIMADGGNIELLAVIGNNAKVRLVGACVG